MDKETIQVSRKHQYPPLNNARTQASYVKIEQEPDKRPMALPTSIPIKRRRLCPGRACDAKPQDIDAMPMTNSTHRTGFGPPAPELSHAQIDNVPPSNELSVLIQRRPITFAIISGVSLLFPLIRTLCCNKAEIVQPDSLR